MSVINAVLRAVIDAIQAPLEGLDPLVGLVLWSIPTGVFALYVFKWTSSQDRIAAVKRRIHACLFEIRLFNDDLRAIVRAQGEILRHVLHYQGLALVPMVFILPPLVLLMVHLHAYYGFQGLEEGDSALLRVGLVEGEVSVGRPEVELELPAGLGIETEAVWIPSLSELNWQIGVEAEGYYRLVLEHDGVEYVKTIRATNRTVRLSPVRPDHSFLGQLEWPSEPPLPADGVVSEISVAYADRELGPLGWQWRYAWMVVFFVLTMIVALVLRKPLGVEL